MIKRKEVELIDKRWFSSVQLLSHIQLFGTPWTAARQATLSITNSQSSLKLMSIESVMPSNHLILCRPLLLPPSIFPSIRVFSNESPTCNYKTRCSQECFRSAGGLWHRCGQLPLGLGCGGRGGLLEEGIPIYGSGCLPGP